MVDFNCVYIGLRFMWVGISWFVLGVLCSDGVEILMDLLVRMGVEMLMEGWFRVVGLMLIMVVWLVLEL